MRILEQCRIPLPPNSEPTISLLPLTFFDLPWLFFSPSQPLFFYEFPHPTSDFHATIVPKLKQSLSVTLQHYYPFAGKFSPSSDLTKPHLICTDNISVAFTVTESNGDFNHFCDNHPRDVKDFHFLVPKLGSSFSHAGKEEFPLIAIQLTLFPNVGICIGLAFHHVVADGRTFHNFLNTWATYCRGFAASAFSLKPLPSYDRSVIVDAKGLEEVFMKEWRKRRLVQDIAIGRQPRSVDLSGMVRATFLMSATEMEKIKRFIINFCKEKNQPQPVHLSPYVLSCAFIWVCLLKIQQFVNEKVNKNNLEDPTYFGFIAGGITRLDYPVPKTYLGNCVGFGRASVRRKELLGEDGIVVAARAIGSTVKKLDASLIAGAEKWILDWEELYESEQHVHATWSPKLKLYELDFGWGRPKKIEEIAIDYTRAFSLVQSRGLEGGFEIGLALTKRKMDTFSMFFTEGLSALP
ncbi:unnamed protein product [Sphenostylis stenocarpa]|uniref:Anthocyanin 5-aromatic acyltransferase n=1 Tax=Sphenostylis stenocarpa TaxID=92480 RepID=A0AA86RKR4_9FABA|nr:unnamed protein product [Sphenostylis stenocarpa]